MQNAPHPPADQSPAALLENLRSQQQAARTQYLQQRKTRQTLFSTALLLFVASLIVWAIGISGAHAGLQKFALGPGSAVLGLLFLLAAFSLYWLKLLPRLKNKNSLQEAYLNTFLPAYLHNTTTSTSPTPADTLLQKLKTSRLLKLQENINFTSPITLNFPKKYYLASATLASISKKTNLTSNITLDGLFIEIDLHDLVQNNALFFSIHNNKQHFESLSFNEFILGDNEVRRLVKQHDRKIDHNLVDEFNKYLLMVGRNPAWLVNKINEPCVQNLLDLNQHNHQNIRIDIDQYHIHAFIHHPNILTPPPIDQPYTPTLLDEHCQKQIEQIQALLEQLQAIAAALYD